PKAASHRKMMRRVMERVVEKITREQACERGWGKAAKEEHEPSVENCGEWSPRDWRHDQPAGIVRVVVMHSMKHEVKVLSPFTSRFIMKNPAVHRVLDQAPD